jgi:hypothetical protein
MIFWKVREVFKLGAIEGCWGGCYPGFYVVREFPYPISTGEFGEGLLISTIVSHIYLDTLRNI